MLGLRLTKGIKKELIKKPYDELVKLNLIYDRGESIALTPQGMLLSNYVINELCE